MSEDEYQNKILNKYLDQEVADHTEVCNMCGEVMNDDTEYCEHCETNVVVISYSDYIYEERQSIAEDKADAERDLRRDR